MVQFLMHALAFYHSKEVSSYSKQEKVANAMLAYAKNPQMGVGVKIGKVE
ncbi:hypothetical protein [Colwellia sp. M166]|nr:hypothetical protein [Colwellia sp. M166]